MWVKTEGDKFRYFERYKDPLTDKNKEVSVRLDSNSRQAHNKAQRLLNEKIDSKLNAFKSTDITFGELLNKWWDKYPHTVKQSTAIRMQSNIKLVSKAIKSDVLLKKITTAYIQDCLDNFYYKQNYSLSTTKQIKSLLSNLFDFAIKYSYIENNPMANVKIKKKPMTFDEIKSIKDIYLEREEVTMLLNSMRCKKSTMRYADLTEILALTGMRIGEAASLTLDNYNGSSLKIEGTLDYYTITTSGFKKDTPKTKNSYREITLSERAIEIIDKVINENELYKTTNPNYKDNKLIFCTPNGTRLFIENYNRQLHKHSELMNIDKNVTSHILRHTHISILSELGVPLKVIMDRVGHAKPDITLMIYSHVTENMKDNLLIKLNEIEI